MEESTEGKLNDQMISTYINKTTRKSLDTTEDVLHMRMMEFRLLCNKTQIIPELSDHSVRIFLAGGDNDVNQAFDGVLEYFNQKKEAKHMFDNRDPMSPDIQQAWEVLKVCFLPKLTPQGYRILLCGLWDPDPAKLDVLACIRMFLMAIDVGLFLENVYQGYVLLLDTEGLTIRHFPWGSLTDYRRFMRFLQYGMPVFVRQIHILRNSKMIERVYTCLKPFMKKELSELWKRLYKFSQDGPTGLSPTGPRRYNPLSTANTRRAEEKSRGENRRTVKRAGTRRSKIKALLQVLEQSCIFLSWSLTIFNVKIYFEVLIKDVTYITCTASWL
ncbi:uncharacterized protein LOC106663304 isoform X1 [Cimex lectularius]|uniref:CRAL-TRIO domain-containing protein n=1 Tax=Cimex lectularius TaxID=79782 RepID=A0A8I6RGM5_CIMLE|nr:uncharacterized protein LOC106663304 isoform X1 [Cimex lectularius]